MSVALLPAGSAEGRDVDRLLAPVRHVKRLLKGEPMYDVLTKRVEAVYRWAKDNGREPDAPPREIYFNRIDEPLQLEVAPPLR